MFLQCLCRRTIFEHVIFTTSQVIYRKLNIWSINLPSLMITFISVVYNLYIWHLAAIWSLQRIAGQYKIYLCSHTTYTETYLPKWKMDWGLRIDNHTNNYIYMIDELVLFAACFWWRGQDIDGGRMTGYFLFGRRRGCSISISFLLYQYNSLIFVPSTITPPSFQFNTGPRHHPSFILLQHWSYRPHLPWPPRDWR